MLPPQGEGERRPGRKRVGEPKNNNQKGFYRQIREIEAETGCRFQDTFLIEAERAVDYSKIWVETVQRVERPCWALGM